MIFGVRFVHGPNQTSHIVSKSVQRQRRKQPNANGIFTAYEMVRWCLDGECHGSRGVRKRTKNDFITGSYGKGTITTRAVGFWPFTTVFLPFVAEIAARTASVGEVYRRSLLTHTHHAQVNYVTYPFYTRARVVLSEIRRERKNGERHPW